METRLDQALAGLLRSAFGEGARRWQLPAGSLVLEWLLRAAAKADMSLLPDSISKGGVRRRLQRWSPNTSCAMA